MPFETLLLDTQDGVATITFNRPNKRNAMSPRLHEEMTAALEQLRYDKNARVVVITGAGPAFCAGMDLKEFFTELKSKPDEYDRITPSRGRMARPHAALLPQADHRDDQRLLFRRRVFDRRGL